MKRSFLFLFLVVACAKEGGLTQAGKWCTTTHPGKTQSYAEIDAKLKGAFGEWGSKFSAASYQAYIAAVDKEATAALYQLFNDYQGDATHVWYGSFNKPGTFGPDKAEGFRVVSSRNIMDASGQPRLILAITFWTYRNGVLQLVGGADSMRVRLQVEGETKEYPKGRFVGLSYHVDTDAQGKVTALKPTATLDVTGKVVNTSMRGSAVVPSQGMDNCFYCHSAGGQVGSHGFSGTFKDKTKGAWELDLRKFPVDETLVTPETKESIKEFLATLGPKEATPALIATFKTPKKTFYPEGILNALAGTCDRLGATK